MKKKLISLRRFLTLTGVVVLMLVVVTACRKDSGNRTPIPAAGLMVFNLAVDQDAVGVALSGNPLTQAPLDFTSYNGHYQNIFVGSREVESYDYRGDSLLARSSYDFEDQNFYSLFVLGNSGSYRHVVALDEVDSTFTGDKAYIRYINAIPDSSSPVVTIGAGGSSVLDSASSFASVSPFVGIDGGEVDITVSNGGTINATRKVTLENGKIYTALLVGIPESSDTTTAVQIRYVANGSVPETQSGQ